MCNTSTGPSRRSGTLWEGRFRSCVVGEEAYLLGCYRYTELNPVRAGMVSHPADYPWSSYVCNAQGETNPLVSPHALYLALGKDGRKRQAGYRELFRFQLEPGLIDEIRRATNGGFLLGSERFQKEIAGMLGRRAWPGAPGRPRSDGTNKVQRRLALWGLKKKRGLSPVFRCIALLPGPDAHAGLSLRPRRIESPFHDDAVVARQ